MINRRKGWFGNSQGHSLAAKGIKLYSKKQELIDPRFYWTKRERMIPTEKLSDDLRKGETFYTLNQKYPDVDLEELRLKGIKVLTNQTGDNTLKQINENGVDMLVSMAKHNPFFKEKIKKTLKDSQQMSFIQEKKVDFLKTRMRSIE